MAVTAFWFGQSPLGQYSATAARRIDWVSDTIKTALATSTYTPNQDTHVFFSDVTNEVVGTGYTAGGVALGSKTLTYDAATNETRLDAADPSWSTATITARYAIIYKDTATASTSPLMGYVNYGADQAVVGGTFTIQFDATGALKATAA